MQPSWKQFVIGVLLGIAAWLIWFLFDPFVYLLLALVGLSAGLVKHAPCILATGAHGEVCAPEVARSRPRSGLWQWLKETAVVLLIIAALSFVGPRVWEIIRLRAPSIAAVVSRDQVLPLLLGVLWVVVVSRSFLTLRRRAGVAVPTAP